MDIASRRQRATETPDEAEIRRPSYGGDIGTGVRYTHGDGGTEHIEGKIALVCGNEGSGISPLVQKHCDFLVALPQRGKIASLNVTQATTAIAYEWLRKSFYRH